MNFTFTNCMGEKFHIFEEPSYEYTDFSVGTEAVNWRITLKEGDVWLCHYAWFPVEHQDRPSIIINSRGIGPLIMVTGHIDPRKNEWKKYPENIVVEDWKNEGFDMPSYANTKGLYKPSELKIYSKIGTLGKKDYNRIVKPTVEALENEQINSLFESVDLEFLMDSIEDFL